MKGGSGSESTTNGGAIASFLAASLFSFPSFSQENYYGAQQSTTQSKGKDKFAPRFDGLRFIETLITAHR